MKNSQNHIIEVRNGRARRRNRAFTLIEVMISVALVLLLMYGVSQVFKLSSDAVGANQALSKIIRDHRAAAATLADDFRNSAADSPLFLISSRIGFTGNAANFANGFRSAEEQRNNRFDDPTTVDGTPNLQFLRLGSSDRVPRLDRMGFFARGLYRRQTAPDTLTAGAAAITSGEAYIWVGHVQNAAGVGPEQQFSSDRILGRMAILLANVPNSEKPFVGEKNTSANIALAPFAYDAQVFTTYSDVARISLDQFRQNADGYYQSAGPFNWFRPMEDNGSNIMRYRCNPTVSRPMTPQSLSQSVPYFLGNCTQFIVEYAGDYLNQDPVTGNLVNGTKQDLKPGDDQSKNDVSQVQYLDKTTNDFKTITGNTDGQIDFIVDAAGTHSVRWYGLPRDTDGDGVIGINDVIPLADVLDYYQITVNGGSPALAPWEKDLPNPSLTKLTNNYANFSSANAINFRYTCAWHNDAPPMIRILVKIDDPTGKLQDGQWYEYIFTR